MSTRKKISGVKPFRRNRAHVEKLEDRILLSAEPLLQKNSPQADEPVAVDNIEIEYIPPSDISYNLDTIAPLSTIIDLSKAGNGADQNSALTAEGSDLLILNQNLINLVIDLGDADDDVTLSTETDGRLRLSGDSIIDLIFARPTSILAIRGGDGNDNLLLREADIGSASLIIEAETLSLPVNQSLITDADIVLRANDSVESDNDNQPLSLLAQIDIQGSLIAGGLIQLEASVSADVAIEKPGVIASENLILETEASVSVGAAATIQARELAITATTTNTIDVYAEAGSGSVVVNAKQITEAGIAGGATLIITPAADDDGVTLLVEAVGRTQITAELNTLDSVVTSLIGGFDVGVSSITLDRNTSAYIGDDDERVSIAGLYDATAGLVQVSAANLDGDDSGIEGSVVSGLIGVQTNTIKDNVSARIESADMDVDGAEVYALNAGSYSSSAKVARNIATGDTIALLKDVDLAALGDVLVVALDEASFTAASEGFSAEVPLIKNVSFGIASASNTISRNVSAKLQDAVVSSGGLYVIASSRQTLDATTESLAVTGGDGSGSSSFSFGGTFAWNQLLGKIQSSMTDSEVDAGDEGNVTVQANNASEVNAKTTAGTSVSDSPGAAGGASLSFNAVGWDMGNIAAATINSLLGSDIGTTSIPMEILSLVTNSTVDAGGDLTITATDEIALDAYISNSAESSASEAAGALSIGAAAVLASNRVRSDTRARVYGLRDNDTNDLLHVLTIGGAVDIGAEDAASIAAEVSMSSSASTTGGSAVAVGGIVVRNDVRNTVLTHVGTVAIDAGDALSITAVSGTEIVAELSGEVIASSEEAAEAESGEPEATAEETDAAEATAATDPGVDSELEADAAKEAQEGEVVSAGATDAADTTDTTEASTDTTTETTTDPAPAEGSNTAEDTAPVAGGGAVAVNGLIATNLILSQVEAVVLDSELVVASSLAVEANNDAAIEAANTATTESSGTAVGATLAFNTIGWQAQNILYGAIDALLGTSIGNERPLSVRAEISGTTLDVGEDLSLTAVQVPQISATIENSTTASGDGAAVSFVLASNMLSSRADARLTPVEGDSAYAIGGDLLIKASDTAGIEAEITMDASSGGGVGVGGIVARNDVRNAVRTTVDSAAMEVEGDVTIEASGSATITATMTGNTQSLAEEDAATETPATDTPTDTAAAEEPPLSLAVNALIATNLVLSDVRTSIIDSDIVAGGNLDVIAQNNSLIEAENSATMSSGGTAVGVMLAFNTIGWESQNVLFNAIDTLLGTSIGDEQPAQVQLSVTGSLLEAGEDMSLDAANEAQINAVISNEVSADSDSTAASMILASNLVSSRARAWVRPGSGEGNDPSLIAGGDLTLSASDAAGIEAEVSSVAASGGGMAIGGMVVRNDVRSDVEVEAREVDIESGGNLSISALEAASIIGIASGETSTIAAPEEEDTAAADAAADTAAPDDSVATDAAVDNPAEAGAPLAVNALIVTNMVLSEATALVIDSGIESGGDITVAADNTSLIEAENSAVLESDGVAVGVVLAFNTVGWKPQNLFANAIDALLGTSIGDEQPANTSAKIINTEFTAEGDVSVTAGAYEADDGEDHGSLITATISNEAAANNDNAAAGFVLASNLVSSRSTAWVSPVTSRNATSDEELKLSIGGSLTIAAVDSATIDADIAMSATSGGGAAVGGVVVRNDVRSAVDAGLDRALVTAGEDVTVIAIEAADIKSVLSGTTTTGSEESEATGLAVNALIATNNVLSSSTATITNSNVTAGGDLQVDAQNTSGIIADNTATISSSGTAVGVTLAFNSVGWEAQDLFRKSVDALIGSSFGNEIPALVLAKIENSAIDTGGDLLVTAAVAAQLEAATSNEASSTSGASAAASMVLSSNMVSSKADALSAPHLTFVPIKV